MSRGLGRVQRAVLAFLEEEASYPFFRPEHDWPLCVFTQKTGYHPESLRRAMKSLERAGHVELGWSNGWSNFFGEFLRPAGPTARLSAAYLSTLKKDAQPSAEDRTDTVDNGNGIPDLSLDSQSALAQLMEALK